MIRGYSVPSTQFCEHMKQFLVMQLKLYWSSNWDFSETANDFLFLHDEMLFMALLALVVRRLLILPSFKLRFIKSSSS